MKKSAQEKNTSQKILKRSSKKLQGQHMASPKMKEGKREAMTAPRDSRNLQGHRRKNILATILGVVGVAFLVAGIWLWWDAQSQYNAQNEVNEKLAGYTKVSDDGTTPPQVDWASLKVVNSDVCAWIQIPGTTVNYPVYKGATNDTYLRTSAFGSYSIGGQIFMDSSNKSADLTDEQTLAYGHHLNDGSMFAPVAKMDDQAYFDSIQRVWWVTPVAHSDGTYGQNNFLCEPLFCYHVSEDDTSVRKFQWASPDAFHRYLSEKLAIAITKSANAETDLPNVEHILSLATCEYSDGHGRSIIVCNPVETTTQDTVQL